MKFGGVILLYINNKVKTALQNFISILVVKMPFSSTNKGQFGEKNLTLALNP